MQSQVGFFPGGPEHGTPGTRAETPRDVPRPLASRCRHRVRRYLNSVMEQDHRAIRRGTAKTLKWPGGLATVVLCDRVLRSDGEASL
jgi:transposase-like protein